ncbi:hypothetical protein VTK73DRAFT_4814 [Phialemonium thermophilum]|uniref:Uncharacterized protein n=1 Tax=Phialemonium thermophilum TaxID=223376 RepID=A0ABR3WRY4_9PEZI
MMGEARMFVGVPNGLKVCEMKRERREVGGGEAGGWEVIAPALFFFFGLRANFRTCFGTEIGASCASRKAWVFWWENGREKWVVSGVRISIGWCGANRNWNVQGQQSAVLYVLQGNQPEIPSKAY